MSGARAYPAGLCVAIGTLAVDVPLRLYLGITDAAVSDWRSLALALIDVLFIAGIFSRLALLRFFLALYAVLQVVMSMALIVLAVSLWLIMDQPEAGQTEPAPIMITAWLGLMLMLWAWIVVYMTSAASRALFPVSVFRMFQSRN